MITAVEDQEISGFKLQLFVIDFPHEKMTLRVPVNKAESTGMRKLSSDKAMKDAMETLASYSVSRNY